MLDSVIIDKLYACLLDLCHDPDYDFGKFSGKWGYKGSQAYQDKYIDFLKSIQHLAKAVPVKTPEGRDDEFYMYDGKIYVQVRRELISAAYDQLLIYLRVSPMIGNRSICDRYFINIIGYYNKFSPRPDLVAFKNGVLDLREYRFYDFNPRFHVTYYHPYEYNEKAQCPKWLGFLHEVLPDKNARLILQMFLGLGLMERGSVYNPYEGKNTPKVELCLILLGPGGNGKSTISNTALGIFGKERISELDYDDLTAPGDEGMRARVLLRDAIFNWSQDSDYRTFGKKRSGVFKRLVSGEGVTSRKLGKDVEENCNMPFLIFNLNDLPYSDDQSLGFIRRLQFISFEQVIPKERQNPALSNELIAEYPGIFNWIMRGARELKRRKFVFPSSEGSKRQMLLAQLKISPVAAWMNAYHICYEPQTVSDPGRWMHTKVLMESLSRFCVDNGECTVTKQKFGQAMARTGKGFAKKHQIDGNYYLVFGCDEERLTHPYVIQSEDMMVEDWNERNSYIQEDD